MPLRQISNVVAPTAVGLYAMYTGFCRKGSYPVFIKPPDVTIGPFVPVVVYEYSSV